MQEYSIAHVANVIENKISSLGNWYCSECVNVFNQNEKVQNAFLSSKYAGNPCLDTVKICKEVDRFLKIKFSTGDISFSTIHYTIIRHIDVNALYSKTDYKHDVSHKLYLIRSIIDLYV